VEAEAEEHRAEEGQNEEGQDEDVDVVTIDDEAEEVHPTPSETQVMLLTQRAFFQQLWDDIMCSPRGREPCCGACLSMLGWPYVSQSSIPACSTAVDARRLGSVQSHPWSLCLRLFYASLLSVCKEQSLHSCALQK